MAAQAPSEPKRDRGHQAPAAAAPPDPAIVKLREHQSAAARQPFAEECRSLVALSRYGVLSTISIAKDDVEGFPSGSIVGYADAEDDGAPLFVFSSMSGHTRDVMTDGRASLTVTAPGFEGAADARVCLTGMVRRVPEAAVPAARDRYLARHPDAFWVTFGASAWQSVISVCLGSCLAPYAGDFTFWRMEEIRSIRLVGGFARAGAVPPAIYAKASPDPVAGCSAAEVASANLAGDAAWCRAAAAAIGADAGLEKAKVLSVDRLGANLGCFRGPDFLKLRLPFAQPADTPAAVAEQLAELVRAGVQ